MTKYKCVHVILHVTIRTCPFCHKVKQNYSGRYMYNVVSFWVILQKFDFQYSTFCVLLSLILESFQMNWTSRSLSNTETKSIAYLSSALSPSYRNHPWILTRRMRETKTSTSTYILLNALYENYSPSNPKQVSGVFFLSGQ